jgi:hypothetical protein
MAMMITLVLMIATLFCTSSSIAVDPAWFSDLDMNSPNYHKHLYCGTVARGATYLYETDKRADTEGFIDGVEQLIKINKSRPRNTSAIFTSIEIEWVRNQLWPIASFRGKGPEIKQSLIKMYWHLWRLDTVDNTTTPNLATILTDVKELRIIQTDKQAELLSSYLLDFPPSKDLKCETLRRDLLASVKNRRFFIPSYTSPENIEKAIKNGIEVFSKKLGLDEVSVYSIYVEVLILYLKQKPDDTQVVWKLEDALEIFAKRFKPSYFEKRSKGTKYQIGILIVIICNKFRYYGLSHRISRILDLTSSEVDLYENKSRFRALKNLPVLVEAADAIIGELQTMKYLLEFTKENKEWHWLCPEIDQVLAKYQKRVKV